MLIEMLKELLKDKQKVINIISLVLVLILLILFFFTDFSAMIFENEHYRAYKYALECVEDELKFPNTATYPSFKETKFSKSQYGVDIIISLYEVNSPIAGKSYRNSWDISGSGTCENSFGMKMNYCFVVTVVRDDNGDFWCYKCVVD